MNKSGLILPEEWLATMPYVVDITVEHNMPIHIEDSFQRWLYTHLQKGEWAYRGTEGNYRVCFMHERDAIMFTLRWS